MGKPRVQIESMIIAKNMLQRMIDEQYDAHAYSINKISKLCNKTGNAQRDFDNLLYALIDIAQYRLHTKKNPVKDFAPVTKSAFYLDKEDMLEVTNLGKRYINAVTKIEQIYEEILEDICKVLEHKDLTMETLSLGVIPGLAYSLLPEILKAFRAKHRNIGIKIITGSSEKIKDLLLRGVVDAGIVNNYSLSRKDSNLDRSLEFFRDHPVWIYPKNSEGKTLNHYDFIMFSADFDWGKRMLKWINEDMHAPSAVFTEVTDMQTALLMVNAGLGASVVPNFILNQTRYPNVEEIHDTNEDRKLITEIILRSRSELNIGTRKLVYKFYDASQQYLQERTSVQQKAQPV
ncbi:MAG: LysR family transcriptional regulator substrate-binding protein [Peptococcaceae bacterium]|nr:LysR family transcriptional regulator substrate-binding protein [Peptococcaceae bacterium]